MCGTIHTKVFELPGTLKKMCPLREKRTFYLCNLSKIFALPKSKNVQTLAETIDATNIQFSVRSRDQCLTLKQTFTADYNCLSKKLCAYLCATENIFMDTNFSILLSNLLFKV